MRLLIKHSNSSQHIKHVYAAMTIADPTVESIYWVPEQSSLSDVIIKVQPDYYLIDAESLSDIDIKTFKALRVSPDSVITLNKTQFFNKALVMHNEYVYPEIEKLVKPGVPNDLLKAPYVYINENPNRLTDMSVYMLDAIFNLADLKMFGPVNINRPYYLGNAADAVGDIIYNCETFLSFGEEFAINAAFHNKAIFSFVQHPVFASYRSSLEDLFSFKPTAEFLNKVSDYASTYTYTNVARKILEMTT